MLTRAIPMLRPGFRRVYEGSLVARINQINWLSRCGLPLGGDLTLRTRSVETQTEAEALNIGKLWGDAELEFQNQLTLHLHEHARSEYQAWNRVVERAKEEVIVPLESIWRPLLQQRNLSATVISSLQWDVLGALMESAYRDIPARPAFFLPVLEVYESGHLPCGWDGEYNVRKGTLLVW